MWDTVDLHAPSSSVRTPVGDLLLGPAHWGRLYLKGLRVPEPSRDVQTFRFGHNLVHGSVDRDRKRLVDASEAMANRCRASCADASGAERLVSESTAKKLWAAIRREPSAGGEFYCQTSD
ncbi:hypothetical protein BDV24DRAFT_156901 [Aspergillus arachidicola]|uniref:Uncharacterized protein n=1 Tax=Aspergillus arachidicola TaxID=656916 RepID=A0A5N6XNT6_9EURO|nr:hypothetical protein BDV24DRAFT_156901 [Aspergillus arachidicola]